MNPDLRRLLDTRGGVAERATLLAAVPRHVLDHALRSGAMVRPHPRVYADPRQLTRARGRARAALTYAGPGSALSHLTALGVWSVPGGDLDGPIHLLVDRQRRLRGTPGVVVHRRADLVCEPPHVLIREGLPTSRVEQCVVDSWPLLPRDARRAAVIGAVSERLTTPDRLRATVATNLSLPGRAGLLRLISLLERGCRSELELWGYTTIFSGPEMPEFEWNVPVRLDRRTVYLDAYCRPARLNIELDGSRWHSLPAARERDVRRDAALAAIGIMVVRFTHDQLVYQLEQVRAQIRAMVAARLAG